MVDERQRNGNVEQDRARRLQQQTEAVIRHDRTSRAVLRTTWLMTDACSQFRVPKRHCEARNDCRPVPLSQMLTAAYHTGARDFPAIRPQLRVAVTGRP